MQISLLSSQRYFKCVQIYMHISYSPPFPTSTSLLPLLHLGKTRAPCPSCTESVAIGVHPSPLPHPLIPGPRG